MIQINCTHCKALLQIDDAFAGGVCRCRYCGTIQTVPKHLKEGNGSAGAVATAVGSGKSAKTLYQKKRATSDVGAVGSGSGLDDLAGIVASSGLSSGRLQKSSGPPAPAARGTDHRTMIISASVGGAVALLLGLIIFLAVRDKSPADGNAATDGGNPVSQTDVNGGTNGGNRSQNSPSSNNDEAVKAAPSFLGQPLEEKSVVFVLDHGAASQTERRLDLVKQAIVRSVQSLGSERKFAVVLWYIDGTQPVSYPKAGLKPATEENIAELQKFLDDVYGVGQTWMSAAMEKACKTGADAVVLIPIKTFLDEKFHKAVMDKRGKSTAKVYCMTLAQPDLAPQLKKVAADTQGAYRDVSMDALRAAAR